MSGLPQPIPGIRPVAPEVSLLTSGATQLPAGTDWHSGVKWRGASCSPGHPWPGICPDADLVKAAAATIAPHAVRPFGFYVPYACDWVTDAEQAGMDDDARAQLQAIQAWHISRELWAGDANNLEASADDTNETLMSSAVDLTVAAAVDATFAVAELLSEYAGCTHAGGAVLHLPIVLIPHLTRLGMLQRVGDRLFGPLGVSVSPGPGYPGPGPWGPNGELANAGTVWAYVSGPIQYDLAAPSLDPDTMARRWDRRMNRYSMWAEQQAIVRFDPCCVFAINVDIPNVAPEAS